MYMYVCYGFMGIHVGIVYVHVPVWHVTLMMPLVMEVASRLRSRRTEDDDLLCLLTCGRDTAQHGVVSTVL